MRIRPFRVRILMAAVAVVALLLWGSMMGWRSYNAYRLASFYNSQEYGWRQITARDGFPPDFRSQCIKYFAQLTRKYHRAMWRPWEPVAPDPHAPGFDQWKEQEERRARAVASAPELPPLQGP